MDWDDEFDNGFDEMSNSSEHQEIKKDHETDASFDPLDITNPTSAYLFLSDDAQDEISGLDNRKLKCQSCGHRFKGEIYDRCPACFNLETEELNNEKNAQC
jgi:rubrerythrin